MCLSKNKCNHLYKYVDRHYGMFVDSNLFICEKCFKEKRVFDKKASYLMAVYDMKKERETSNKNVLIKK